MRVMINDVAAKSKHKSGVGHYASELIRCLRPILGEDGIDLWPGERGLLDRLRRRWWQYQSNRYEYVAARQGLLPWVEKKVRGKFLATVRKVMPPNSAFELPPGAVPFDVYHEPNYIPIEVDLPTVASVHDLSAILYPQWHPANRIAEFAKYFHAGLKYCTHLFAISEFGKSEIVKHLGWPADKVTVTYMGVRQGLRRPPADEVALTLQTMGLKPGYLLHVGTLEPRKNVLMLMKAYCALPASVREKCPLVLAGGRGWNSDDAHEYLQREGRHKNVRWLGYVPDGRFAALYSGARALLFPTFYEGFGMPTIEMMACGGAVVASSAGAVAETAGPRACLLDPHDADAWYEAMKRAATEDDWVAKLREGAKAHAARFTWEACAAASVVGYAKAAATRGRCAA